MQWWWGCCRGLRSGAWANGVTSRRELAKLPPSFRQQQPGTLSSRYPYHNSHGNNPPVEERLLMTVSLLSLLYNYCHPQSHQDSFSTSTITMSRSRLTQSSRLVARSIRGSNASRSVFRQTLAKPSSVLKSNFLSKSPFSTCVIRPKGAESTSAASPVTATPTELTDNEYHDLADAWLENALVRFEDIQDQSDEVDVEFSVRIPPIQKHHPGEVANLSAVRRHDHPHPRKGHIRSQQAAPE